MSIETRPERQENTLVSLACNIFVPVIILNKATAPLGAWGALLLALAFPLGYGAWDLIRRGKPNMFSILGLLNTLVTGGLALVGVTGLGFAIKEAAFPLLIGLFVFLSAWTKRPAIHTVFLNPNVFHLDLMRERIDSQNKQSDFERLIRTSTKWLAASFFLSAALNFILASKIFLPMPLGISQTEQEVLINQQIAEMTQWSMLVILVPSMIFLGVILFLVIREIKKMTGLKDDELMRLK
ncbi:MAG TPA: VC0807 family protein [Pseudobdellovibrionaceae bacterium]|nr:VC0807 family protein [Pseudobdellovibrionaceae bacterium]